MGALYIGVSYLDYISLLLSHGYPHFYSSEMVVLGKLSQFVYTHWINWFKHGPWDSTFFNILRWQLIWHGRAMAYTDLLSNRGSNQ